MTRTPLRLLVVAVLVLFAGTTALVVLLSREAAVLTSTDTLIANRSEPSVLALQTMRADVQQEHALVDEWVLGAPGDPVVRAARIDELRGELTRNRQAYFALPSEPGEVSVQKALGNSLDRFDAVIERVRAQPPRRGPGTPNTLYELDAIVGQVGSDLARATDFSADLAKAAAAESLRASRRLLPSAIFLGILSAAAAAGTIALTYRSVRRAEDVEARGRLALETKAQELEAFAGRVAHDLLSPLMTVGLGLDLAVRRAARMEEDPRTSAAIARASTTLQRIRRFVGDLLDFARAGATPAPGAHTRVDDVVREVTGEFESIALDSNVDLHVGPVPHLEVRCSPGVLTSLVSNLVQNAIKYVSESAEKRVEVRALDLGKEVRVEVEDTGPGIEPSDQQRLFNPFVRLGANGSGIGLGLATVRRLAEAHGGHVGVKSDPNHGALFWFSVPTVA